MATINCADCGGMVSTAAAACPHCGSPMRSDHGAAQRVRTIEQTGKIWKFQILVSLLLALAGGMVIAVAFQQDRDSGRHMAIVGYLGVAVGLVWFILARIGAWWCHG